MSAASASGVFELTPVELRVATLAGRGMSNAEIGAEIGVSGETVKGYLYRIARRHGCRARSAIVGRTVLAGLVKRRPPEPGAVAPKVTRRQHEILRLIACGLDTEAIARTLHVSKNTVKTHIRKLCDVFGARNRAHLVMAAYDAGVLTVVRRAAVGQAA